MSRKSHTALRRVQRIPGAASEAEVERQMENNQEEREKRETCKILHSKLHSYPGSTVSPATATSLRFISMVSESSGKYGIRVVRGNTNKNRQVFQ